MTPSLTPGDSGGCSTSGQLELAVGPWHVVLPTAPLASLGLLQLVTSLPGLQQQGSQPVRSKGAAMLKAGLQAHTSGTSFKQGLLGLGALVEFGGILGAAGNLLSPQGPGGCDRNCCERCCNVATSAPFVVCGCHAMRYRKTVAGKQWGASMAAVGVASATFHSSYGTFRTWGRRMDYWSIALASNLMTRMIYPKIPMAVTLAGIVATPFKPFLVSTVNSMAMEVKFIKRARANPKIRNAQRLHATCCAIGLGAFALEEMSPDLPLVHSLWHLLSSTAVATINHLAADVEQHELRLKA